MLQRHPQRAFENGELDVSGIDLQFPGRVVILEGNKHDMGAFRFTYNAKNLILATTDMPDFDDRMTDEKNIPSHHYSKIKRFACFLLSLSHPALFGSH